jgi:hypothetical protein
MTKLTSDEREHLRNTVFRERPEELCEDCGGFHLRACPRIKRQVWIGNGNRTEVEYWRHDEYDDEEVIFPEDVWSDDE